MATPIGTAAQLVGRGQNDDMERAVVVWIRTTGSTNLYSSIVVAEAGAGHPSGVTAVDDLAWWCAWAVEAADRCLA